MKRIKFEPKNIKKGQLFLIKEKTEPICCHIARFIGYTMEDTKNILQFKFEILYTSSQNLIRKRPTLDYTYNRNAFKFYLIKTPEEGTVELL